MISIDFLGRVVARWLVVALSVAAAPSWAIHKCVDASGQVSYQDAPCAPQAQQSTFGLAGSAQPEPSGDAQPQARSSGPAAGDDSQDEAMLPLVGVQALYDTCTRATPDFAITYGEAIQAWRRQHERALADYETSGRYRELLSNAEEEQRQQFSGQDDALVRFCNAQAGSVLNRMVGR